MALFVDGYNALHEPRLAGLSEAGLCRAIGRAAIAMSWRGPLRVVCDGMPKPGNDRSPDPGVQLIYSGKACSADEVIMQFIDAYSAPNQLTVVSSDRAIQKAARRRRATVWSSPRFARELGSALSLWHELQGGPIQTGQAASSPTTVQMGPEQVIGWLRYFGFDAQGNPLSKPDK